MRKLIPWVPPPNSTPDPFTMPVVLNPIYIDAVAWAQQIQWSAHLPEEMELVEAQGYREGENVEWYAAAILRHWSYINLQYAGRPIVFRGRGQTMKSLTKELDCLISKAQVLVDPHSLRAHNAGKGRGKKISKDAAAFALKVKEKVDRIKKINRNISQLSLAKKIRIELKTPSETIRGIIKKHGW